MTADAITHSGETFTFTAVIAELKWLHQESGQRSYTREEIAELMHSAVDLLWGFLCCDCGANTSLMGEYYGVQHDLWDTYGAGQGMLCIGCLEARIGRELVPTDFLDAGINTDRAYGYRSDRLLHRLGLGPRPEVHCSPPPHPDPPYFCESPHPDNPGTVCRRRTGHHGDHSAVTGSINASPETWPADD